MQSDSIGPRAEPHRWVIDLIEAGIASIEVEDATTITIPATLLPETARAGHVLRVWHERLASGGRSIISIEVDEESTAEALRRSAAQVQKGERSPNDPGGNLAF